MNKSLALILVLGMALGSCSKDEANPVSQAPGAVTNMKDLRVPEDFVFSTTKQVQMDVVVRNAQNNLLANQLVTAVAYLEGEEHVLAKGMTNGQGVAALNFQLPAYAQEVEVRTSALGFLNSRIVQLGAASQLSTTLGGSFPARSFKTAASTTLISAGGNVWYMGGHTSLGLPLYLEPVGDVINQGFMNDVSATLPEYQSVPANRPNYLAVGNSIDIEVLQPSEVWVTFVHEGAGFRNSLGYYVYDPLNPPTTASQIDSVYIVFPNTSFTNSGGDMQPGDKVRLGVFPGGVNIGWVLFRDAFNINNATVRVNNTKFYSQPNFNPELNAANRQHCVHLVDQFRDRVLVGFEDVNRESGSDQDFNDCVFYVTANPFTGINTNNFPNTTNTIPDTDGDGIPDDFEDFPTDGSKAFRLTYTGTLAYEDLWPAAGDYDFNDLVVAYEVEHHVNAVNEVVEMIHNWTVLASGASYSNGFGIALDNLPSAQLQTVESWNGTSWTSAAKEAGQTNATYMVFQNLFNEIQHPGGEFINTVPGAPTMAPVTFSRRLVLSAPMDQSTLGLPPYNPFLVVNGDRGREVHLPDHLPTDLAATNRFGTMDDDTDPQANRFYKTANNLPWALHISGTFEYPVEYVDILQAYLKFATWAQSGGAIDADWYLDVSGYRDATKIY